MAFELPALPYSTAALAANGMCQETLELHHGKHHAAYVTVSGKSWGGVGVWGGAGGRTLRAAPATQPSAHHRATTTPSHLPEHQRRAGQVS